MAEGHRAGPGRRGKLKKARSERERPLILSKQQVLIASAYKYLQVLNLVPEYKSQIPKNHGLECTAVLNLVVPTITILVPSGTCIFQLVQIEQVHL